LLIYLFCHRNVLFRDGILGTVCCQLDLDVLRIELLVGELGGVNAVSEADVLVEDKLFATLDPTTRRIRLPDHRRILLTDTVGFIRKLPPTIVTAFRATLEELSEASVLLFTEGSSNRCTSARIVVGGSVERPLRIESVEKLIEDEISLSSQASSLADILRRAEHLAETEIQPGIAGGENSDYLSHLTGVLVRRGLESAMERWRKR